MFKALSKILILYKKAVFSILVNKKFIYFLEGDVSLWESITNVSSACSKKSLFYFTYRFPEFRNIVIHRLICSNCVIRAKLFGYFFKPLATLHIHTTSIGKGLFVQHGFSTFINAKSIGDACWINQNVNIVYEQDRQPIIGNHVRICCGSIIIGDVTIGDNSIIAAGAVVTNDVPPNQIWGGNPAHYIKDVKGSSFGSQR